MRVRRREDKSAARPATHLRRESVERMRALDFDRVLALPSKFQIREWR